MRLWAPGITSIINTRSKSEDEGTVIKKLKCANIVLRIKFYCIALSCIRFSLQKPIPVACSCLNVHRYTVLQFWQALSQALVLGFCV